MRCERIPPALSAVLIAWCIHCLAPCFVSCGDASTAAGGVVQITDGANRNVKLNTSPKRIVIVGKGVYLGIHLLYMFAEGRERLAGMEKRGDSASDFAPLIDPGFSKKPTMGVNPNPEAIASLDPDIVLIKGSEPDRTSEALERVGIPVMFFSLESPTEFFHDVSNLGVLLGNQARAAEITTYFQTRLDRIKARVAQIPDNDKPRVLEVMCIDRAGTFAVQIPAIPWMQTIQVRTAGGVPVWLDAAENTAGWTIVNLEQIAAWDPDKIFVVVWHSLDPTKTLDSLKTDSRWRSLRAVKNGELHMFPGDIHGWDSPDPRWILGMTWLASRLHPDKFKDIDMSAEIREFYRLLYGMDDKAIQERIMPAVHLDIQ